MRCASRWWLAGVLAIAGLALALDANAPAQDKKKPFEKHDAKALDAALKDVINAGARIFNEHGDHAGCYFLYEGSLLSVKPFLGPELQQSVDAGLTNARKLSTYADRAFELRKVLDEIRAKSKAAGPMKKDDEDRKEEKKEDKKKKKKKTDDNEPATEKGEVSGRVTYNGKPVAGGYFVTLASDAKKFSSPIQKDGTFRFKSPIPEGKYRVILEPIPDEKLKAAPLPARYGSAESGLAIEVRSGKQSISLDLTN
jgi:hypothetical protein